MHEHDSVCHVKKNNADYTMVQRWRYFLMIEQNNLVPVWAGVEVSNSRRTRLGVGGVKGLFRIVSSDSAK